MPLDEKIDYEHLPPGTRPFDETDINLRSFFCKQPDSKLAQYKSSWTDEEVMNWEENFKSDGTLMLVCSEREVEVHEYRAVLEEHLRHRKLSV